MRARSRLEKWARARAPPHCLGAARRLSPRIFAIFLTQRVSLPRAQRARHSAHKANKEAGQRSCEKKGKAIMNAAEWKGGKFVAGKKRRTRCAETRAPAAEWMDRAGLRGSREKTCMGKAAHRVVFMKVAPAAFIWEPRDFAIVLLNAYIPCSVDKRCRWSRPAGLWWGWLLFSLLFVLYYQLCACHCASSQRKLWNGKRKFPLNQHRMWFEICWIKIQYFWKMLLWVCVCARAHLCGQFLYL